jgi:alpha-ketoglutaric semialdehyde dehydrogenase
VTALIAATGQSVQSWSPQAPDQLVAEVASHTPSEVEEAIVLARVAQRSWWGLGAAARAAALTAAAQAIRARADEAADLVVREVGKPLGEARGEVARAVSILEYQAQAAFAESGAQYPPSIGGLLYTERRPHGVAGLITPWNFPLAIPLWKAAPALVTGNAVVLKPSPDAVACARFLDDILSPLLPEGLFQVVYGGAEVGSAVVAGADAVSFTGSSAVGRRVAIQGAERGIPVQCEMGGQNAAIVLDDADPSSTAAMIAGAAMGYAGQKCTATRRVVVVGSNPSFVEALVDAVRHLVPGDPAAAGTVVGPLINQRAYEAVQASISAASAAGGRVLAGGLPSAGAAPAVDGWYVPPTLVDGLAPDDRLSQEETFGPFATVLHAADVDQAVRLTNAVPYGLVTSVHGRDISRILAAVAGLDTGMIRVNAPTPGVDFYAPFGGEKGSSYGPREQGMAARDFYSSTRTVTIAPHPA